MRRCGCEPEAIYLTEPNDNFPNTRRFPTKPDKRSIVPFIIAAVAGLGLLSAIWALSDNVGSDKPKSTPTSQTTGLGTSGSVDQPMKPDLQK